MPEKQRHTAGKRQERRQWGQSRAGGVGWGQPDLRGKARAQSIARGPGRAGVNEARERGKQLKYDQRLKACQVGAKSRVKPIRNLHPKMCSRFSLGGPFPVLSSTLAQAVVSDEATPRKQ